MSGHGVASANLTSSAVRTIKNKCTEFGGVATMHHQRHRVECIVSEMSSIDIFMMLVLNFSFVDGSNTFQKLNVFDDAIRY